MTLVRAALMAAVCLGLAAPAGAATAWLAPVDLSAAGQPAVDPQVAVDAQGNAVAVWHRFNGANSIVQSAARPAGGAWTAPVDLSSPGLNAAFAQVAMDPQGNATAVWVRSNGSHEIVQTAERAAGGAWSAPVDLSAAGQHAYEPQLAVDAQGNAVAVWSRANGTHTIVQSAARPAGGAWSAPVDVSAPGQNASDAQVALDPQGNAVAIWSRFNGSNFIVQAAARPAGGAWSAPVDLSAPGQNAGGAHVVVDSQGHAVAMWSRANGTSLVVQAAARPAGGAWQAPVDVSAPGQSARYPRVAVDAQGNAVAVWERADGANDIVQAAVRPAGGAWQAPVDLSAGGQDAFAPRVAVDAQGDAVAVWHRSNGTNDIVQAAVRRAGGAWQAPVDLSAAGGDARAQQVAVDPQGNAVAVWHRSDGTQSIVQAAAYATGPIAALRLSPTSFRAATSGPAVKAAAVRTGTRVSYTLAVAARVRFTVQRVSSGRRAGKRCVTPTRANRGARRCARFVKVPGGFVRSRSAGPDRFTFTGRLRGRALSPGRYRLVATPAGGPPARAGFRVVR